METATTAIVRYDGTHLDGFGAFMHYLYRRFPQQTVSVLSEGIEWNAFPLEETLVAGFWPVMIRMQEKLHEASSLIRTADQARVISTAVTKAVEIGLELRYGSMREAARVCANLLIETVEKLPRRQMREESFSEIWFEPVSRFFGEAVRVFFEKMQSLKSLMRRVDDASTEVIEGRRIRYMPETHFEGIQRLLHRDVLLTTMAVREEIPVISARTLIETGERLERYFPLIECLRKLPFRLDRIPPDVMIAESLAVSRHWLNTQILLAVLKANLSREHVEHSELSKAIRNFVGMGFEKACEAFAKRMKRRGCELDSVWLSEYAREYGASLARAIEESSSLDILLIIRIDRSIDTITPRSALVDLSGEPDFFSRELCKISSEQERRRIVQRRLSALNWSEVDVGRLHALIDRGHIRIEDAVKRIDKVSEKVRIEILSLYLERDGQYDVRIIRSFMRAGLIPDSLDQVSAVSELPFASHELISLIEYVLKRISGEDSHECFMRARGVFLTLAEKLSKGEQEKLLERVDLRGVLHRIALFELSQEGKCAFFEKHSDFLWRTSLAEVIIERMDVYRHPDERENAEEDVRSTALMTWEEYARSPLGYALARRMLSEVVLAQGDWIVRALRKYSEESVFRWYFEEDIRCEELWHLYVADQTAFRSRFGSASAPSEHPPAPPIGVKKVRRARAPRGSSGAKPIKKAVKRS